MPHISKIFQGGHKHHPPTKVYPSTKDQAMEGKLRPRRGCDSQESIRGLLFPTGNLVQPQNQKIERPSLGEKSVLLF